MDHIFSKTDSYSRVLSEKISGDFFARNEVISGEQILKVSPVEQVNLFVIKNLFEKWKEESVKLKSPYFDYDSPQVKSALDNFLVTLSKNISVKKEFFKPLLQKAIQDTLLLLSDPAGFFETEFSTKENYILTEVKEFRKYFRIGRENMDAVVSGLEKEGADSISSSALIQKLKSIFNQQPVAEVVVNTTLTAFSSVLPFEISKPDPLPEISEKPVEKAESEAIEETLKVVQEETPKEFKILNEKFAGNQLTLNDVLKSSEVSLAEKIGKSKVQNIREVISLNQKFMFITTLFQGERTEYENALNQVERCNSYEEAFQILENNYAAKYHWETGKPELLELKEIVYRKFS